MISYCLASSATRKLMRATQFYVLPYKRLKIQVLDAERVLLDEFAAGFYDVTHQLGEQVVCFGHIRDLNLQQGAGVGVKRGFPQLIGVHFAQTFVALQGQAFFTFGKDSNVVCILGETFFFQVFGIYFSSFADMTMKNFSGRLGA